MKRRFAGGRELPLKTESCGHEYSRRASVRVPISQLGSDVGYGKVDEEWGERIPPLSAGDRVSPNLGQGGIVDESVGDRRKQQNYRKQGLPHSVGRGEQGRRNGLGLTDMNAFINWHEKWARCTAPAPSLGRDEIHVRS